ncbi:uroporphyrinogen decarboxylase family protein, partial [Verrucomicrobiota bacterium]
PWHSTLERWRREGMPGDADFAEYFDLDCVTCVAGDISPRYEKKVIEETEDYIIRFDSWGTTAKNWKHASSTPHWIGRTVVDRESWEAAKARMVMTRDRIDWDHLKDHYPAWRKNGWWIQGCLWFGFDVTHAAVIGTEPLLIWMADDPELVTDIFNTELDCGLQLLDMIWDAGYTFDSILWPDDMGYRNGTFFSVDMYRDILKPVQKRAIEWAHAKGIVAHLHSCGNINAFLPELIEIGLDALNPLEVKAGMDPVHLKRTYGDSLVLHGGLNAMLWDNIDETEAEIRRLLPILKQNGGYIFQEDHSIPDSVSLKDFRSILELAKELGRYSRGTVHK